MRTPWRRTMCGMTSTPPWNAAEALIDFVDRVGLRGGRRPRCRPAVRLDGRMMPPIEARTQPAARALRARVAREPPSLPC